MSSKRSPAAIVGQVLAGFVAVAFVLTLPLTMLARNMANVLFTPRALSRILSARVVQSGLLRQTVTENLMAAPTGKDGFDLKSAMGYLTPQQRDQVMATLLPDSWVESQVDRITIELFNWLESDSTQLFLAVDTTELRDKLQGQAGAQVVNTIVDSWPQCSVEDAARMLGLGTGSGSSGFPFCQPPEPLRGVLVRTLQTMVKSLAAQVPAQVPLINSSPQDSAGILAFKEQFRLVRLVARWGILVSLSLLGLIIVFAVRSWGSLARWWGVPLLAGGLLSLVPVMLGRAALGALLAPTTAGLASMPVLAEIVRAVGEGVGAAVLRPQAWQAGLISIFGAVLTIVGFTLGNKRRAAPVVATPPPAASPPPVERPEPRDERDRPSGMFG